MLVDFNQSFRDELVNAVVTIQGEYHSNFTEDGPPTHSIKVKEVGRWLWVIAGADYKGTTI